MKSLLDKLRKKPIATKLKLLNLITSSIVVIFASLLLLLTQLYFFNNNLLDSTRSHAAMIGENVAAAMMFTDKKATQEILSSLSVTDDIEIAAIYDEQGNLFATYYRDEDDTDYVLPGHEQQPGYYFSLDHLSLSHSILWQGKKLGSIYVQADLYAVYI